jgi:voltage-gated potassium channel
MMGRRSRLLGAARGKFGYLLVALTALLLSAPVMTESWVWKVLIALFVAGVLVAGLYAVRPGRRSIVVGLGLASVEFTIGRLAAVHEARWLLLLQILLWIVALLYVTVSILEWVLGSPEVTLATLQAAFCVYLLLGLFWAYLYALMVVTMPDSFRVEQGPALAWTDERSRRLGFIKLFIFSYSTLSGTGLGDLEPSNGFADMAASLEAMSAQVYLAVVIARLVGVQAAPAPPVQSVDAPDPLDIGNDTPE